MTAVVSCQSMLKGVVVWADSIPSWMQLCGCVWVGLTCQRCSCSWCQWTHPENVLYLQETLCWSCNTYQRTDIYLTGLQAPVGSRRVLLFCLALSAARGATVCVKNMLICALHSCMFKRVLRLWNMYCRSFWTCHAQQNKWRLFGSTVLLLHYAFTRPSICWCIETIESYLCHIVSALLLGR